MTDRRRLVTALGLGAGLGFVGMPPLRAAETSDEEPWDVLVVGSGAAGLSAALAADEAGAGRVAILEKMAIAGGHTLVASGSVNAYDPEGQKRMGRTDSTEAFFRDTYEGGGRRGDPDLISVLVHESEPMLAWLKGHGVPFDPVLFEAYNGVFPRAHRTVMRRHGYVYVETLSRVAKRRGIPIFYRHRAQRLLLEEGAVAGVECQTPEGRKTFRVRAVVLATGGFGASAALRMRWAPIFDESFFTTYAAGSSHLDPATGDGIRMAEAVGAALRDMDAVMAAGRRFTDETGTWQSVLDDLSRQGEKEFWVITDGRSRKGATFATKVQQGTVGTAQDLSELAIRMGIPANALRAEMEKYNRAADLGRDEEFGRTRFTQRIETPPFYFGRERFDIHYTCGGVAINAKAEVKNAEDLPIAGLFAAGEVTGGVHGNFRLGGNGLTDAFVFGRVAGRSAALHAQTLKGA